jgi:hypothetical protein
MQPLFVKRMFKQESPAEFIATPDYDSDHEKHQLPLVRQPGPRAQTLERSRPQSANPLI